MLGNPWASCPPTRLRLSPTLWEAWAGMAVGLGYCGDDHRAPHSDVASCWVHTAWWGGGP